MELNEQELKNYVLEHIAPTSKSTLSILQSTIFIFSTKYPETDEDKYFGFCIKPDYENNIFYVNNTYSLSEIMANVKRCVFYHPQWKTNYSRETKMKYISENEDWKNCNCI